MKVFFFLVSCLLFLCSVSGYIIEIAPKAQECFSEDMARGDKMSASYEVINGGMLDINVKVRFICKITSC